MRPLSGWLRGPVIYRYDGWLFEFDPYTGPWPLRKDMTPKLKAGDRFYAVWQRWYDMTAMEQEQYRVGGGCVPF